MLLSAKIVTCPAGGYFVDLYSNDVLKRRSAGWAMTLWGARRCARRLLKRERRGRARVVVETVR